MSFTAALPTLLLLALALVMFGLGLSLTVQDFARLREHPRAVLLALVLQMVALPAVAVGLIVLLDVQPIYAVGLMLLAGPEGGSLRFSEGELVTLVSAVAIAGEIILISRYAGQVDVRRVTVVQLATASLLAFLMIVPTQERIPDFSWLLLASALGLGAASAAIQVAMNWAQKSVSPTRATLIYAGEPVWAGIVGRIAGERLPALALLGGALIVLAVIISEWKPKGRAADADQPPLTGQAADGL